MPQVVSGALFTFLDVCDVRDLQMTLLYTWYVFVPIFAKLLIVFIFQFANRSPANARMSVFHAISLHNVFKFDTSVKKLFSTQNLYFNGNYADLQEVVVGFLSPASAFSCNQTHYKHILRHNSIFPLPDRSKGTTLPPGGGHD